MAGTPSARAVPVQIAPGYPFPTQWVENPAETAVTTSPTEILRPNANRLEWYVENVGTADMRIGHRRNISATVGELVASGGGFVEYLMEEDGQKVLEPVFAIGLSASTTVYVWELFRADTP